MNRECVSCIKRKTTFCPTSMECMATDDMPYYRNRIMLLDENQKQKEVIDKITSAIQGDIDGFLTINEHGECNDILELLEIYLDILKEGKNE